nr:Bardet-Biedl syndrome 7 protein homolog isoform X1 [Onthophagus taurus]
MELELYRIDYTVVGVTSNNCMKLIPSSCREQQKIAVADNDGVLQVFSVKKEDIQLHFKTLPGSKISSLQLAGEYENLADKMFIASENEIRGYTKKGKLFLSFDTNLTEPIISMYILGNDLFVCGKHIFNHYRDCKDIGSYLCGDCIVDVLTFQSEKTKRLISLIACEGRMIRALEHARVTISVEVEAAPTVLYLLEQNGRHILFGTVDGRIGILDVESNQPFKRWLIDNKKFSSGISTIYSYDITGDGNKNLFLGRNDGNIEIYTINILDELDTSYLLFVNNCNESVTSIQCGFVGSIYHEEVLICTYTGRIFGLTPESNEKNIATDTISGNYSYSSDTKLKISKLKLELEELQIKVTKEREKYQTATLSYLDDITVIPNCPIKDSMVLSKLGASYVLSLEVSMPIDNILLQSDVPLDLLDVEKNSAVVSYCNNKDDRNYLLATYRCQVNTNRLEVNVRTIEGQYGILQVYITPIIQPKFCQVRFYEIKPLSLHLRIHHFEENKPFNTLTIKGSFSLAEMHSWVYQCLPEVPEKPQLIEKTELYFQSTFLGTILYCSYWKGEGVFKSDNVSTISILKEFMSKEATKKKIKVDITVFINDESINHVLKTIEPKLKDHIDLVTKVSMLDALHELEVNDEQSLNSLSPKYKDLLANETKLRAEYVQQPSYLDRFYGVITDLYVDYHKLKGVNVKTKVPKLLNLLDNFDYDTVLAEFRPEIVN